MKKIFIAKSQGIYSMFSQLGKIGRGKDVLVQIDPEHEFFENSWWAKALQKEFVAKNIRAIFSVSGAKQRKMLRDAGFSVVEEKVNHRKEFLKVLKNFFFAFKNFHLMRQKNPNVNFYLVLALEGVLVIAVVWVVYFLIVSHAQISIQPRVTVEDIFYKFRFYPVQDRDFAKFSRFLSVPYETGVVEISRSVSVSPQNLSFLSEPSRGVLRVVNKTPQEFSLVENTRFVTEDGKVFRAERDFVLPAATGGVRGEATIGVVADEFDEDGDSIGVRGNLAQGTKLWIRNLTQSFFAKEIEAEVVKNFVGGQSEARATIQSGDFQVLEEKFAEDLEKNLALLIAENVDQKNKILVLWSGLADFEVLEFSSGTFAEAEIPFLRGRGRVALEYGFVWKNDFEDAVEKYLAERASDTVTLQDVDLDRIQFLEGMTTLGDVFVVPTQVQVLQRYDFEKDVNGVIAQLRTAIAGLSPEEAREKILSVPEIASARISLRPPWNGRLPRLKSKLYFRVKK